MCLIWRALFFLRTTLIMFSLCLSSSNEHLCPPIGKFSCGFIQTGFQHLLWWDRAAMGGWQTVPLAGFPCQPEKMNEIKWKKKNTLPALGKGPHCCLRTPYFYQACFCPSTNCCCTQSLNPFLNVPIFPWILIAIAASLRLFLGFALRFFLVIILKAPVTASNFQKGAAYC